MKIIYYFIILLFFVIAFITCKNQDKKVINLDNFVHNLYGEKSISYFSYISYLTNKKKYDSTEIVTSHQSVFNSLDTINGMNKKMGKVCSNKLHCVRIISSSIQESFFKIDYQFINNSNELLTPDSIVIGMYFSPDFYTGSYTFLYPEYVSTGPQQEKYYEVNLSMLDVNERISYYGLEDKVKHDSVLFTIESYSVR